jgi:NAD(P)H-hydrate epimerase
VGPLTREQAREIDRRAMTELGIPGIVLMENAARGIAAVARDALRERDDRVAIVCGPGNIGGDGFAAARHLANAGADVRIHVVVPPEAYADGSDAAINLRIARAMGIPFQTEPDLAGAGIVLDCLFGTGLIRSVRDPFRAAILAINAAREAGATDVSIDVPSGLTANTGEVHGLAVHADVTATMVAPKTGFALALGPAHAGRVVAIDIGVPPSLVEAVLSERL